MSADKSEGFKLVAVDNFNTETVSDYLIADNIRSKDEADLFAEAWNKKWGNNQAPRFCRVMPAAYKLYKFEP